eukprot:10607689-Alexandrium_andersonii.AAC.1
MPIVERGRSEVASPRPSPNRLCTWRWPARCAFCFRLPTSGGNACQEVPSLKQQSALHGSRGATARARRAAPSLQSLQSACNAR